MLCRKSSRQRSLNFLRNSKSQTTTSKEVDLEARKKYQETRLGLARRLHETLAQDLVAIGYRLDAVIAEDELSNSNRAELRQIRLMVMESARNFREEIYKLRKTDRLALHSNVLDMLSHLEVSLDLNFPLLRDPSEDLLLEAIMEMARNTQKHAKASRFYLKFNLHPDFLTLEIGDDGSGKLAINSKGFGLRGVDEALRDANINYSCRADKNGTHYTLKIARDYLIS